MTIGYIAVDFAGTMPEAREFAATLAVILKERTGGNGVTAARPTGDQEHPEVKAYVNGPRDVPAITAQLAAMGWEAGSQQLRLYASQNLSTRETAQHLFKDYGPTITV